MMFEYERRKYKHKHVNKNYIDTSRIVIQLKKSKILETAVHQPNYGHKFQQY